MTEIRRFHFVPIGGTAMVPLAALLAERGHRVTGSDKPLYPPMSTTLERLGIPVSPGFAAEHVPADCDAVIVGNAALSDNVEAAEAKRRGIPVLSLPQAVRQYLLPGKTSIVITGTHGKTTTSALTAWLLLDAGRDPGFIVGGELQNLGRGYRQGAGPHFVLEGDEYNAAFFDRGPKFLHYEPRHLFVGNIEYDHADLYPDLPSIEEAFRKVVSLVPPDGTVVINADDPRVVAVAREARAPVVRVSLDSPDADFSARDLSFGAGGTAFTLLEAGLPTAKLAMGLTGRHNVRNALGAIALARGAGLSTSEIARALPRFSGVKRRLEIEGREERHRGRGRLRASPHRRREHARSGAVALSGPAPVGALRAPLEHRRTQDVRGGVRRRLRLRRRARPRARLPRAAAGSGCAHRPRGLDAALRGRAASRPSRRSRSRRSPRSCGARRGPATCCC